MTPNSVILIENMLKIGVLSYEDHVKYFIQALCGQVIGDYPAVIHFNHTRGHSCISIQKSFYKVGEVYCTFGIMEDKFDIVCATSAYREYFASIVENVDVVLFVVDNEILGDEEWNCIDTAMRTVRDRNTNGRGSTQMAIITDATTAHIPLIRPVPFEALKNYITGRTQVPDSNISSFVELVFRRDVDLLARPIIIKPDIPKILGRVDEMFRNGTYPEISNSRRFKKWAIDIIQGIPVRNHNLIYCVLSILSRSAEMDDFIRSNIIGENVPRIILELVANRSGRRVDLATLMELCADYTKYPISCNPGPNLNSGILYIHELCVLCARRTNFFVVWNGRTYPVCEHSGFIMGTGILQQCHMCNNSTTLGMSHEGVFVYICDNHRFIASRPNVDNSGLFINIRECVLAMNAESTPGLAALHNIIRLSQMRIKDLHSLYLRDNKYFEEMFGPFVDEYGDFIWKLIIFRNNHFKILGGDIFRVTNIWKSIPLLSQ